MQGVLIQLPGVRFVVTLLLRQVGIYPVMFYGLVAGSTSTYAAANTTALQALWVLAANNGVGGTIWVPAATYSLNATTLNHNLAIGVPISLEGGGPSSILKLWGTTGPLLDVASNTDSQVARGGIRNIKILHGEAVTSGATIRLGRIQTFDLTGIQMLYDTSANAAMICVQVGVSTLAANDLLVKDSIFWTSDNTGTQIGFEFATGGSACGNYRFLNTRIKGNTTDSIAVRFNNSTLIDTVYFDAATILEQHQDGISKTGGAGIVSNLFCRGTVLDQIVRYGVRVEASVICQSWTFDGCWVRVTGLPFLIGTNGGAPLDFAIINCPVIRNDVGTTIYVVPGVGSIRIQNNTIESLDSTNSYDGVLIGDNSTASTNVLVTDNRVTVGSTATSSIKIGSAVDAVGVFGNLSRGKDISFGGSTSASRCYEAVNNPFKA